MTRTMEDVIRINKEKGWYFFSKSTMDFFNSKVESKLFDGTYFVTSEDNFDRSKKLYTIREFDADTGCVETVGDFNSFETLQEAYEFLIEHILGK